VPVDVQTLLRQARQLESDKSNWDTIWQELADYILPRKNSIVRSQRPGSKRTAKVFDSMAIRANELLASGLQGSLTSSAVRWFSVHLGNEDLDKERDVKIWRADASDHVYNAINRSNFSAETLELYLDLGAFGTGLLFTDELPLQPPDIFGGLRSRAYPIGSYSLAEDSEGRVNTVFRQFHLSLREALLRWPETIADSRRRRAEKNPFETAAFLHIVMPRVDAGPVTPETPNTKLPFASYYVDPGAKTLLEEGGFHELPYMAPRWTKSAGETYGRGPGMTALPDITTLNEAVKLRLSAWAKAVDPPLQVRDRSVVGRIRLTPASINVVRGDNAIIPLESGAKFDVANFQEEKLRESIRAIFFSDQLQFPVQEGTPITATEAAIRFELMQRILGPTMGRLETEFLAPFIARALKLMLRAGALPPVPQEVLDFYEDADVQIDIRFEGPLARVQRTSELDDMNRFFAQAFTLSQIDQNILPDNVKLDDVLRHIAKVTGFREEFMRTLAQSLEIKKTRTDAQNRDADISQATDTMQKLAPFIQGGQGGSGETTP
jgi:hypothetical protein